MAPILSLCACHEATLTQLDSGDPLPDSETDAAIVAHDVDAEWLAPVDAHVQGSFGGQDAGSTRQQDTRVFTIDPQTADFAAPYNGVPTDRFFGLYEGGGYRIEVPKNWNGELVVYAHGYVGMSTVLAVQTPGLREHWVEKGFAWAASSYTHNWYDVRAGVEDTNKLAMDFVKIVGEHGLMLDEPKRRYIVGHSMGGHIAAAAVEQETLDSALNRVAYNGALPMCGVLGDTELMNYFGAYQTAAQHLANMPVTAWPVTDYAAQSGAIRAALFTLFPSSVTDAGAKLRDVVMNLSGGARPIFALGFASPFSQQGPWGTFGGDGTIGGILEKRVVDTRGIDFQLDSDPAHSAEESALNAAIFRVVPDTDANPLRTDGLRFIPKVNGEITSKVVTLHTLGDLYVPFSMEQIYRRRVIAHGQGGELVQRAIRAVGHCAFDATEERAAFDALVDWVENGVRPDGDDVLDRVALADPAYGCKFTAKPTASGATTANPNADPSSAASIPTGAPPPPPPPPPGPAAEPSSALQIVGPRGSEPPCPSW